MENFKTKPVPTLNLALIAINLAGISSSQIFSLATKKNNISYFEENLSDIKKLLRLNPEENLFFQNLKIPENHVIVLEKLSGTNNFLNNEQFLQAFSPSTSRLIYNVPSYLLWVYTGIKILESIYKKDNSEGAKKIDFINVIDEKIKLDGYDKIVIDESSINQLEEKKLSKKNDDDTTLKIFDLFEVDENSDKKRVSTLLKLSSLYWEVNSKHSPLTDLDFLSDPFFSERANTLEKARKKYPLGFFIGVGERLNKKTKDIEPYVRVIADGYIKGLRGQRKNFSKSKAGQVVRYIRKYLDEEEIPIIFSSNCKSCRLISGKPIQLSNDIEERPIIASVHNNPASDFDFALFPGHSTIRQSDSKKTLKQACDDAVGVNIEMQLPDSSGTTKEVGKIEAICLNNIDTGPPYIDAAFASLDEGNYVTGFGKYNELSATGNIRVSMKTDLREYKGKTVVTLDASGEPKFGTINGFNAAVSFDISDTGHSVVQQNAVTISYKNREPFAAQGMSGSLVFLLEDETKDKIIPLGCDLICIGYITAVSDNKFVSWKKKEIAQIAKIDEQGIDYDAYVQLLKPVMDELLKANFFRKEVKKI